MAAPLDEIERLALVDALADGAWHSGETLAAAAGISRAALSKRVEHLRDWELDVESRQGLGYRLNGPLERLEPARLRTCVPGLAVDVVAAVDSTNTRLLAADPARDPQALLAEYQSAGRGRRGRDWVSPFGANLYLSAAWSFASWPRALTALPLAAGVACVHALVASGVPNVQLKWPNDLVAAGRKLGGILIEHRGEAGAGCRVVVGIGLNVAMSPAQAGAIAQPWVTVHELCRAAGTAPASRNALATALLRQLAAAVDAFAQTGFDGFAADWARLDLTRDREITVQAPTGELRGIARGVDAQGALIVERDGECSFLHSGEVSLRLATP